MKKQNYIAPAVKITQVSPIRMMAASVNATVNGTFTGAAGTKENWYDSDVWDDEE